MYIPNSTDRSLAGKTAEIEIVETLNELESEFGPAPCVDGLKHSNLASHLPPGSPHQIMQALALVMAKIIDADNSRMEADVIAMATGSFLRQGVTMRDLAKKYGVTVAALSKRVVQTAKDLELPPSHFMRSEKDRGTYALTNRSKT
jgi:hypothetical protein